tara:strand:- start:989 stop:1276 length:288 start_codon:yes stop_codon:yes gene_type:complete
MSNNSFSYSTDPLAQFLVESHIEAAMCLWEAFLEDPERYPNFCKVRDTEGTAVLRSQIGDLAPKCCNDYDNATEYHESFDWDFCPDWLEEEDKNI